MVEMGEGDVVGEAGRQVGERQDVEALVPPVVLGHASTRAAYRSTPT